MLTIWNKEYPDRVAQVLGNHPDVVVMGGDLPPVVQGNVLLCLGKHAHEFFVKSGLAPKGRTVAFMRGKTVKFNAGGGTAVAMFSYAPTIGMINYGMEVDLKLDFNKALRLERTGSLEPKLGQYRYVPDFDEMCNQLQNKLDSTTDRIDLSLDLETLGLDPYALGKIGKKGEAIPPAYIITIQLTHEVGFTDVVHFGSPAEMRTWIKKHKEKLTWLLNHPRFALCGANLKYDLHWLHVHATISCSNFRFDTTLVGSLLDENRGNGLDNHVKIYVPELAGYSDSFDATIDKSRMDLVPPDVLLPYAGGDTDGALRVKHAMRAELIKDRLLTAFYVNIMHPAARAFEKVEQGGIHVDLDRYDQLELDVKATIDELTQKAKRVLGGRIVYKHMDDTKEGGINLTKASLLNDYMFSPMGLNLKPRMFTEKSGAPSTALEHLLMFEDVPEAAEFVGCLKEYSSATKTLSTYIHGFRKHLRSDGRFHPSYYFFAGMESEGGTVTGRLSARDPAVQTLPKHTSWGKRLRSCFTAPKGFVVCEKDYSQGELKIMACVANEPNMIQAYMEGKDLHAVTAAPFAGYTYEEMVQLAITNPEEYDRVRQYGKAGNFGLLYGMGVDGFIEYAKTSYGLVLSYEDAKAFRDSYFDTYRQLPVYHQHYKALARNHGQIVSPLGRIRHLPLAKSKLQDIRAAAERQAINSGIQSTLSDMLIWAEAICDQKGYRAESPCFGAIHDATYTYVPEDNIDKHIIRELEVMESLPFEIFGWKPQLKFTADAKYGPSMGELKKWKMPQAA